MANTPTESQKRAILYFWQGSSAEKKIKLNKAGTILGRESGDIILGDPEISSTHCQIQFMKGEYHLFDMNSSNGTFVNGQKIIRQKLSSGDRIQVGKTTFVFTLEEEATVQHIPTAFQAAKFQASELPSSEQDKTSIVDTLLENEIKNAKRWQIALTVSYADGSTEHYELQQNPLVIGRASSFGRFEKDSGISRRHLLVKLNDNGEVFVEDEASTNGSFLNGKRIHGIHLVGAEDRIAIGSCEIKIKATARSS